MKPAEHGAVAAESRDRQPEAAPEASVEVSQTMDDLSVCAEYSSMKVSVSAADISESDIDTICKNQVNMMNTGGEKVIVHLKKRLDIEGEATEIGLKNHSTLNPGTSVTLRYRMTCVKGNGNRYMEVLAATAAITATDGCVNAFKYNTDVRELIGVSVEVPRPAE